MTPTDRPDESYDDAPNASTVPAALAIIGLGRAGTALALEFVEAGLPIAGTWNRTERKLPRALSSVPNHWGGTSPPEELLQQAGIVLLAVSDDVVAMIATEMKLSTGTVLFHTSGSMPASVLGTNADSGHIGSYHPLQAFVPAPSPRASPLPYCVALEGGEHAIATGHYIARATGHGAIVLQPGTKSAYHAAAVLASNGLVALMAAAVRVLAEGGIESDDAWKLLRPLVQGTVDNLDSSSPAEALTGPIVRGDASTIARNLRALQDDPGATSIYRALGSEAMRLAAKRGMSGTQLALLATALVTPVERANDD